MSLMLQDLVTDSQVHRDAYLSPAVFAAEMDKVFGHTWVYVGHESEIAETGDYKVADIGATKVILTRTEDGVIHAVQNRCSHRGATICQDERGNANFFRCAYHGWTFRNNGDLVGVSYPSGYAKQLTADKRYGLTRTPRVDSYRGLVFASAAVDGPTLREHLAPILPFLDLRLDAAPFGLSLRSGAHRMHFPFNWKIQCENVVDGYHANFVHHTAFAMFTENMAPAEAAAVWGVSDAQSLNRSADLGNGHGLLDQRPMMQGEDPLAGLRGTSGPLPGHEAYVAALVAAHGAPRAKDIIAAGLNDGMNLSIFPNLQILVGQFRVIHPRGPQLTEIEQIPTWLDGVPDEFNTARLRSHELFYGPAGLIGPDDLEVFRRVGAGLSSSPDGWVDFTRGRQREEVESDGIRWSHITDEGPQRSFWAQWTTLMAA
jgi:nitrite reductase/ring-hydroxylating ferredoxin subunit